MESDEYQQQGFYHDKAEWQAAEILSQRLLSPHIREAMTPKPPPRRMKRMVAESQKDDKYWEKRKRNNDAARRSRENRRKLEQDIRTRLIILEEENSLLRKEMTVLKTKFNLPTEQRFLSMDDNGELVPFSANTTLPRERYNFDKHEDLTDDEEHLEQDAPGQGAPTRYSDGQGSLFGDSESTDPPSECSSISPSQNGANQSSGVDESCEDSIPMKKRRIKLELDCGGQMRGPSGPSPNFSSAQPMFSLPPNTPPESVPVSLNYYPGPEPENRKMYQHRQPNYHYRQENSFPSPRPVERSPERGNENDHCDVGADHRQLHESVYPSPIRHTTSDDRQPYPGNDPTPLSPRMRTFRQQETETQDSRFVIYPPVNKDQLNGSNGQYQLAQQRETEELRSRLRMLSEEVAKMKDFVMKDQ